MENLKKKLIDGEIITFENEFNTLNLSFGKTLGGSEEFIIELNCKIIKMCKTFKSFEKKLNLLIEERNLILIENF